MKTPQTTEVYITKYALTKGIFCRNAEINDGIAWIHETRPAQLYSENEYFLTLKEAQQYAESRRQKRITFLKKQLLKIQSLEFKGIKID